ncbi:MAG: sensor histidine kinase [Proteobacteria bacterium]|nr:sensor histidine kinase [Pseudomonadota bacterium]
MPAAAPPDASGRQAAIARAKLDWESTADALAELVCLLGGDGEIMRTNRVIEDWSLGTVSGVLGRHAHTVLHAGCRNTRCGIARFLKQALGEIRRGTRGVFELQDTVGARFVHLTVRPMRRRPGAASKRGVARAVLVVTDQSALYRARNELERLNSSLEERVRARTQALADANRDLRNEIVRREQAEVALRGSRNELVALSEQLIGAQEGERKRIAVELHDSVGQSLSAVKYTLERGMELLRQPRLGNPADVFELAMRRIQETAESIRAISMNLRPKILDDLGAASAVQWFCRDFAEIYPKLSVVTELDVSDGQVPDRLATVVYRSVQELLNNVAKHSDARHVAVKLTLDGRKLVLEVRDNGVGLDKATPESRRHGSGLRNLRERAQMTGGQFSIVPAPGSGTLAQLSWPLADEDRAGS